VPLLSVILPLLPVVLMPTEAEKIELKGFRKGVVLQQIFKACAKIMRGLVLALAYGRDNTAGNAKRVSELLAVTLMQVTEAPKPFRSQNAPGASASV